MLGDRAKSPRLDEVRCPSERYPEPLTALRAILSQDFLRERDDVWVQVYAGPSHQLLVEIARTEINTLKQSIDLPAILRRAGLHQLTERASAKERLKDGGATLWLIRDAAPGELSKAVHAVLCLHYELGESYGMSASIAW